MLSQAGRLNADTAMTAIDALDKVCLARLEAINVQSADKVSLVADKMERDLACARARLALDIARIEEELARIDARLDAVMKPRGVFSAVSGGMDGAASRRRSTSRISAEERARHVGML